MLTLLFLWTVEQLNRWNRQGWLISSASSQCGISNQWDFFTYCNSCPVTTFCLILINSSESTVLFLLFISVGSISSEPCVCSRNTWTYAHRTSHTHPHARTRAHTHTHTHRAHTPLIARWDTWSRGRLAPGQGSGSSSQAGQSGWPCPAVSSPGWEGHRSAGRQTPAGSEASGLPAGSWRGLLMPDIAWTDREGQSEKEWRTRQTGGQERKEKGKHNVDN